MPAFPCMRCRYPLGDASTGRDARVVCPECGLGQSQAEAEAQDEARQWTLPLSAIVLGLASTAALLASAALGAPALTLPAAAPAGAAVTTVLAVRRRIQIFAATPPAVSWAAYALAVLVASAVLYSILTIAVLIAWWAW